MGSGGGGGGGTTVQKTEPWDQQKPYLEYGFGQAQDIYEGGPAQYYPGQTYVDMSDPTKAGLEGQVGQAQGGTPTVGAATNYATSTLSGNSDNPWGGFLSTGGSGMANTGSGAFLNNNPFLDATYGAAADRVKQDFSDVVMPGIAAQFGNSGGAGGELHKELATKAGGQLTDSLGSLAANIYGGNYQQERDRMEAANAGLTNTGSGLYGTGVQERLGLANLAPGLEEAGYLPWQKMQEAGQQYEQFGERVLEDDINRFNYGQNADLAALQDYMSMISGNYGSTSTSRNSGGGGSGASTALGAASLIASMF